MVGIGVGIGMPFFRQATGAAPQGAVNMSSIFSSYTKNFEFNPDRSAELGGASAITYVADTSFNLPDLSGQGVTCTNNSATCPIYTASESTINNRPIISGDNTSSRYVFLSWNPPAPATTNVFWYIIARCNTWSVTGSQRHLIGGGAGTNMGIRCLTSTPQVGCNNGGTANLKNMTVGTWFRIMCLFTGSTVGNTDAWQLGSSLTSGLNFGNSNPTNSGLFCINVGGVVGTNSQGDFSIACAFSVIPSGNLLTPANWATDPAITSADAQWLARCGTGIQF